MKCPRCGKDIPKGQEVMKEGVLSPCAECVAEIKEQMKKYPKWEKRGKQ